MSATVATRSREELMDALTEAMRIQSRAHYEVETLRKRLDDAQVELMEASVKANEARGALVMACAPKDYFEGR